MSLFRGENPQMGDNATINGVKIQTVAHFVVPIVAASVAQVVFIAPAAYQVVSVREVHNVVGGSGATVTVEKCTGTVAPGSGTVVITTPLSGTSTINTVQSGVLATSTATLQLAAGDRLVTKFAGTLTGLAGSLEIGVVRL